MANLLSIWCVNLCLSSVRRRRQDELIHRALTSARRGDLADLKLALKVWVSGYNVIPISFSFLPKESVSFKDFVSLINLASFVHHSIACYNILSSIRPLGAACDKSLSGPRTVRFIWSDLGFRWIDKAGLAGTNTIACTRFVQANPDARCSSRRPGLRFHHLW